MEIKPFRAYRYNGAVVGDPGSCIAPPYDVISPSQQQELYERSEYNIARIIKGKTKPSDSESNNQYTRAAEYLNSWIENGALKQDTDDSIYGYVQDFQIGDRNFRRLSFISLAKLEEFGKVVRPHEQTLTKPRIDRLNLKRATGARFGLVFMLYEDAEQVADKAIEKVLTEKPMVELTDEQNVRHRLFAITSKEDIEAITKMMSDKSVIIADGHHRYETGLAYAKESDNPAAQYQMLAFTNTRHEGLIVLATHRLVSNLKKFSCEKLITDLKKGFEVTQYQFEGDEAKEQAKEQMLSQMKAEQQGDKSAFGVYCGGGIYYTAVLKDKAAMDVVAGEKSKAWRGLDVSVLHKLILEQLLGIGEAELAKGENLQYVKDTPTAIDDSIAMVDGGEKQAAFFMNPVTMQQLKEVTEAGEKMPQKSTYFYPKIFTGMTINKL